MSLLNVFVKFGYDLPVNFVQRVSFLHSFNIRSCKKSVGGRGSLDDIDNIDWQETPIYLHSTYKMHVEFCRGNFRMTLYFFVVFKFLILYLLLYLVRHTYFVNQISILHINIILVFVWMCLNPPLTTLWRHTGMNHHEIAEFSGNLGALLVWPSALFWRGPANATAWFGMRGGGGGCRYFTTMLRVSLRICLIKCSVVLESPNKLYTLNILPENQLCATTSSQYIIKLCSNNLQCSSRTHLRSGVIHSKQKLRYVKLK